MPNAIEIESPNKVRIHDRTFEVFHRDPPLQDGEVYGLEGTARDDDKYTRNHLHAYELRGVLGKALPSGLSIAIEGPNCLLKRTSLAYFENLNEGPVVKAAVYFDYGDWHIPIHLVDFAELLKTEMEKSKDVIRRVGVEQSDASVTLFCVGAIAPTQDCYEAYQALDNVILQSYRACLRLLMRDKPVKEPKSFEGPVGDSHGFKWWVRYVVVPVVGAVVVTAGAVAIALMKLGA